MNIADYSLYLSIQAKKVIRKVEEGDLDPQVVNRVFQNLLQGNLPDFSYKPPNWWRTPAQQIATAEELWPNVQIPEPPANFEPQTDTEILLLHVSLPYFGNWVQPVCQHLNLVVDQAMTDNRHIRRSPNCPLRPTVGWVGFDPEHGRNMRPNLLWRRPNLAGAEVLSAMVQFPDWPMTWEEYPFIVNMSGLQFQGKDETWRHVPSLQRWGDTFTIIGSINAEEGVSCVSPSVREL